MQMISCTNDVAELIKLFANIPRDLVYWSDLCSIRSEQLDRFMNRLDQNLDELNLLQRHLHEMPSQSATRSAILVVRLTRCLDNLSSLKCSCERYRERASGRVHRRLPSTVGAVWNELTTEFEQSRVDVLSLVDIIDSITLDTNSPTPSAEAGYDKIKVVSGLVPRNPDNVIFDFEFKDENGEPMTCEGKFMKAIFEETCKGPVGGVARGLSGVGKTCALREIGKIAEKEMKTRFRGGVAYITFGHEAGENDIIGKIAEVVEVAGGVRRAELIRDEKNLNKAIQIGGQWFQHHACLFLFDDVWCLNGVTPSIVHDLSNIALHDESRIAFTTRDGNLQGGRTVLFEPRERRSEAAQNMMLSCASLSFPVEGEAVEAFHSVLDKCAGLPLTISLVGSVVRIFAEEVCRSNRDEAWQWYLDNVESGVAGNEPRRRMRETVLKSLEVAEEVERGGNLRRRFASLCVIRNQRRVPIRVIERVWGVDNVETKRGLETLRRFSIVNLSNKFKEERTTSVAVHDLILEVARDLAKEHEMEVNVFAHSLIESYLAEVGRNRPSAAMCRMEEQTKRSEDETVMWSEKFKKGWECVEDDGYINDNICWLLKEAGKIWEARWLVMEPKWIVKQLKSSGYSQFSNDVKLVEEVLSRTAASKEAKPNIEILKLLDEAGRQAAMEMRRGEWDGMGWFQLYGRLIGYAEQMEEVDVMMKRIVADAPKPWVRPSVGCLPGAGGALKETLHVEGDNLFHEIVGENLVYGYRRYDGICMISQYNLAEGRVDCENIAWDGSDSGGREVSCAALCRSSEVVVLGMRDGSLIEYDWREKVWCRLEECEGDSDDKRNERDGKEKGGRWLSALLCCCKDTELESEVESKESEAGSADAGLENAVRSVAITDDGGRVVAGSDDGIVQVWIAVEEGWNSVELRGHKGSVESVAITKGGRIVSGSRDGAVRVWDTCKRGWKSCELRGHQDWVRSVAITKGGGQIVSGSYDGTVRAWGSDEGEWKSCELRGHQHWVVSVAITEDGGRIVSGSYDGTVRVWDACEGGWNSSERRGHQRAVFSVAITEDGGRIVSGSYDGTMRVWDTYERGGNSCERRGHQNGVLSVAITEDGGRFVSGSYDGTVRVWDTYEGGRNSSELCGHRNGVMGVAITEDGGRIVSGSLDGTVCVWEMEDQVWTNTHCKKFEGWVEDVSVVCEGAIIRIALLNGGVLYYDWDLEEESAKRRPDESMTVATAEVNIPSEGELLQMVEGEEIWPIATGFCVAKNTEPFLVFLYIERKNNQTN